MLRVLVGSAVLLLAVVAPAATAAFTAGTPAPGLRSFKRASAGRKGAETARHDYPISVSGCYQLFISCSF